MHGSSAPSNAPRPSARGDSPLAAVPRFLKSLVSRPSAAGAATAEPELDGVLESSDERRFMTLISHELRTPLNGVLGMAEVMAMNELSDDQRERLRMLQQSAATLRSLVDVLIEFSLIEAGELELDVAPFDLRSLLRKIHAAHLGEAQRKGLAFELRIEDGVSRMVSGDADRVQQVLNAFVSNALKFTETGRVSLGVAAVPAGLRFDVRDTGIGIAEEHLADVFDSFSQVDGSLSRLHGGAGLGLALSHRLCQAMGGEITVDSALGEGSLFSVVLPLAAYEPAEPQAPASAPEPEARPLRVLAAEDNSVNRAVLKALLDHPGIELSLANNGQEAVQAWEAGDWDLVLMDIQMPVLDGIGAARQIRARERELGRRRVPIIATTANTTAKDLAAYRAAGMNETVAKPIKPGELLSTIAAAFAHQQAHAKAATG
jgi:CheY-like chemotaxis protein